MEFFVDLFIEQFYVHNAWISFFSALLNRVHQALTSLWNNDVDDKYRVSCRKYLDFIKELQKREQVNIDKMAEFEYICRNWKTLSCQGLRPSARIGFHQ